MRTEVTHEKYSVSKNRGNEKKRYPENHYHKARTTAGKPPLCVITVFPIEVEAQVPMNASCVMEVQDLYRLSFLSRKVDT